MEHNTFDPNDVIGRNIIDLHKMLPRKVFYLRLKDMSQYRPEFRLYDRLIVLADDNGIITRAFFG